MKEMKEKGKKEVEIMMKANFGKFVNPKFDWLADNEIGYIPKDIISRKERIFSIVNYMLEIGGVIRTSENINNRYLTKHELQAYLSRFILVPFKYNDGNIYVISKKNEVRNSVFRAVLLTAYSDIMKDIQSSLDVFQNNSNSLDSLSYNIMERTLQFTILFNAIRFVADNKVSKACISIIYKNKLMDFVNTVESIGKILESDSKFSNIKSYSDILYVLISNIHLLVNNDNIKRVSMINYMGNIVKNRYFRILFDYVLKNYIEKNNIDYIIESINRGIIIQ